jgi:CRISPR-associated protein (TIGR02584 family)
VVTETLYALAIQSRPRVIPQFVRILTTENAYSKIASTLPGTDGAIARLRNEYQLPPDLLRCSIDDVVLLRSRSGRPLADIRTSADSRDAGEAIVKLIAELHADPDVDLHCSLAGGRKTMGALLALALQLSGRPGDHLYHVLVNEPFDSFPEFFYPPPKQKYFGIADSRVASSRARIDLAEVPLVRMGVVAESLGLGTMDLARRAAMIEAGMNRCLRLPSVRLQPERCAILIDGMETLLPAQQFALYALYAQLRQGCSICRVPGSSCSRCHPTDDEIFADHRPKLLLAYRDCRPEGGEKLASLLCDRSATAAARDEFADWLRQARSKLNRRLRKHLFRRCASPLPLILGAKGSGQAGRRGLRLPPASISFANVDAA